MEHDVLNRYFEAARVNNIDTIIRLTGEDPYVRADTIQDQLNKFIGHGKFTYSNHVSVFSFEMLEWANDNCPEASTREHVTRAFMESVDYPSDLERMNKSTYKERLMW